MKTEEEIDEILQICIDKMKEAEENNEQELVTFIKGHICGICLVADRIEEVKE